MMDDARDTTENDLTEKQINRKTIKSFIGFAAAIVLAVAGWIWLNKQPEDQGALLPLRKAMDANEKIFSSINSETNLAPTYPLEKAEKNVRVNGLYGLKGDSIIEEDWRLQIIRNSGDTLYLTMDELKSFPKTEIVFDFK